MVKFSKQLEAQLIPEWKGAFVNYWLLKKDVKKIKILRKNGSWIKAHDSDGPGEGFAILGCSKFESVVDFLKEKITAWLPRTSRDGDAIQVRRRISTSAREDVYETELLQQFEQAETTKAFFARLDEELNKVNEFYRNQEGEFLERAETLMRQMQILIDLKAILSDQESSKKSSSGHGRSESGSDSTRSGGRSPSDEGSVTGEKEEDDVLAAVFEKNGVTFVDSPSRLSGNRAKTKKGNAKLYVKSKSGNVGSGRIGNLISRQMRVDIPATTPSRTVSAITQMLWEDLANQSSKKDESAFQGGSGSTRINKKKMQHAEKMIRGAFVELYKGLGLLKTYSSLNMVAFGKILKKFDKVSEQQTAPVYLKAVERSYFSSSDKAINLAEDIECTFTKYFMEDDRKKAMKFLRPREKKDSHAVTFFIGLFTGCFIALFGGYVILAHLTGLYTHPVDSGYIATFSPIFSVLALLNLHIFLYGCNIFMWRSKRINYSFIFEFSPSTELTYRDVFLICTTFMTVVVGGMVAHLTLRLKGFSPDDIDAIPAITLLVFTGVLFCPFNIFYRSTRFCFLKVMRNIMLAPLYKVVMTDFFMADQLTSQILLLRNLEYIACYYLAGSFATHDYGACHNNKLYKEMAYVISFLPYYWRAMQCARRWFEEGDVTHLANLGKYVSAMIAAGARLTFTNQPHNNYLLALVVITSTIATVYQLYWDFVRDWGLLNPRSKNPWLRDELLLKHKSVYFVSMGLNFVLRLAWVQSVMHLNMGTFGNTVTNFLMASLEVIRRGHWNFYRLENEHLTNVGKFRAVKTVPLPFREVDTD